MKRIFYFLVIFTVCLTVIGCQTSTKKNGDDDADSQKIKDEVNDGNRGKDMNGIDIYEFAFIGKAPEAKEKHSLRKVIKVYFSDGSISEMNEVAIDVASKEIYKNPSMRNRGLRFNNGTIKFYEAEQVMEILEKHEVQKWKRNYTFEDPTSYQDGYSCSLWLQYEDGTVQKYRGEGTDKDDITPDNFDEFAADLSNFVDERLGEK
ncbi:hypothetical protein [Lentibacillus sp. Marseille-P4043]|uniref:hypothetical protein n=1 Tax=Lentibacillus sp. Marseille-P4043 TaxID=2040293 RepID=UPI000D0B402C|nr:hypothetical protein [Lentibacillus sp. Marseille-P4043]